MAVFVNPKFVPPQSSEGFYAINNPFQESGPKGFREYKIVENGVLFVRMDLPGILKECLTLSLDPSKKIVHIRAFAPSLNINDPSPRTYAATVTGTLCNCCEISGFTSEVSDGVLRLLISKIPISLNTNTMCPLPPRSLNPHDSTLTGPTLIPHPAVIQGPNVAYEFIQIVAGGLYVGLYMRIDMPGVPKNSFNVSVTNGRVRVTGQAPAVSHDSAGRFYSGVVAVLLPPVDIPISQISITAKYGVIRLLIRPQF